MSCKFKDNLCTKCCQAIHLKSKHRFKGLYGDVLVDYEGVDIQADNYFVAQNWKKMSTRLAKKVNPYIFSKGKGKHIKRSMTFYKCKYLTDNGCGVYDTRPSVCRTFPDTLVHHTKHPPNYSVKCLPELKIPVKVLF